jgi:hypothetical protein
MNCKGSLYQKELRSVPNSLPPLKLSTVESFFFSTGDNSLDNNAIYSCAFRSLAGGRSEPFAANLAKAAITYGDTSADRYPGRRCREPVIGWDSGCSERWGRPKSLMASLIAISIVAGVYEVGRARALIARAEHDGRSPATPALP